MTTTHPKSPTDSPFALERIRAAFPALSRMHGGQPVAYFDGPGGTQVPEVVVEALADYLRHHNANTHWRYPTSEETDAALAAARAALADFLNCGADEVSFGANMTTLTLPPRTRARPPVGTRATRSSSPSSIITPTWTPGAPRPATAG